MRRAEYDDPEPAPPTVIAAITAGTVPVPFLAIYAVLFIVHGTVHPVVPPDITGSTTGELIAGIIAAALLVISVLTLLWATNGRRRWPFAVVQAGLLAATLWLLVDGTRGGELATVIVLIASAVALVLIFLPPSWMHYGDAAPWLRHGADNSTADTTPDTTPDTTVSPS